MEERRLRTILESLAETIDNLHLEIDVLKYEKKKLAEELELYRMPLKKENENGLL